MRKLKCISQKRKDDSNFHSENDKCRIGDKIIVSFIRALESNLEVWAKINLLKQNSEQQTKTSFSTPTYQNSTRNEQSTD